MNEPITPTPAAQVNNLAIPIAIVIAGALVAAALFFGGGGSVNPAPEPQNAGQNSGSLESIAPVTSKDHIRGSANAKVVIVEYSDMECPFCKSFHPTVQRIMNEYGENNQVAWVYRHFPLDSIHSKARSEAVAAECAAELGGNDAFWAYLDRWFELTPSNNQTDTATVLPQIAREIGLNESAFATCLTSEKYDEHIQDDLDNAIATGGQGTPWSVIVAKNGKKFPLSGAQPYEAVKQIVELALKGG